MAQQTQLTEEQIARRIEGAPRLASLRSIGAALSELVYAENSFTSQIAEVIRRDPSLTSRLLKLVNSVFFGLSQRVNNIEEAIFYLGLRQIRELALATPIIEDFEKLHGGFKNAPWQQLWRHSIGCGIVTREVLSVAGVPFDDDTDYIVGLVHNVGKIVSASVFPAEFTQVLAAKATTTAAVCELERELIGWDHARIGAYYLEKHHLGPEIVEPVRWHNDPQQAGDYTASAAAVQLSDHMVRTAGIEGLEPTDDVTKEDWVALPAWRILFGQRSQEETTRTLEALSASLHRLPRVLKGMI